MANDTSVETGAILNISKQNGEITSVHLDAIPSQISRFSVVRKITEWNERGIVDLKQSGFKHSYRLERPLPNMQEGLDEIVDYIDNVFEEQEVRNLQRLNELLALVTNRKCLWQSLAAYFREATEESGSECGHCAWCETHKQIATPEEQLYRPHLDRLRRVLDECNVRDDPRLLTKVGYGIKSPRLIALNLYCNPAYESLKKTDFVELIRIFAKECQAPGSILSSESVVRKPTQVSRSKSMSGDF